MAVKKQKKKVSTLAEEMHGGAELLSYLQSHTAAVYIDRYPQSMSIVRQ